MFPKSRQTLTQLRPSGLGVRGSRGMQTATGIGGKLSLLPGQAIAGSRPTIGPGGVPSVKLTALDHVDFGKPERYIKEIIDFL